MVETTADLISRVQLGDREAVGNLLARNLPGLRAYVRLNMGRDLRAKESSSDIVQSACRKVIENLEGIEYEGERAFRVYLYRTALHRIISRQRHYLTQKRDAAREVRFESPVAADLLECYRSIATPSQELIRKEEIDRLEAAFDELTLEQREVLSLRRVFGMNTKEIATYVERDLRVVRRELADSMLSLARRLRD